MASSEYISREAAEKVLSQPVTMSMCLTLEECKQKNAQRQIDLFVIRGLPAADVRPVVKATWKRIDFKPCGHDYECSSCGWKNDMATHFCPNCGADMREES